MLISAAIFNQTVRMLVLQAPGPRRLLDEAQFFPVEADPLRD